jgi:hypothetical protein
VIERFLFQAIKDGIDEVTADPASIERLFTDAEVPNPSFGIGAVEAARVRSYWENDDDLTNRGAPVVQHGYPHGESEFPGFFLTLTGENEETHFMGDETGQLLDDPSVANYGAPISGSIWKHQYTILVITQHIDITLYYYQLLKSFLVAKDKFLKGCGLLHLSYSGSDLAPDKAWMPAGFFVRRFTIDCSTEYNQVTPDGFGRAWKVGGIHVHDPGTPGEAVGGVKTLVTIVNPLTEGE